MSSANKRRGSLFETSVLRYLREKSFMAERLAKAGAADEGDVVMFVAGRPYVLELKATVRLDLPQFWREATIEAQHYQQARGLKDTPPAFVIVKRRQAGIEQAWVIQTLEAWTDGLDRE